MGGMSVPGPGSSGGGRRGGRSRRRKKQGFGLQITSLMDVLMIIVVFLLKSYGLSSMSIVQPDKLELPVSKSIEAFGEGVVLVIAQDQITVDNEAVLQFKPDPNAPPAPPPGTPVDANAPKVVPTFELPDGAIDPSNQRGILAIYDVLKRKKDEFDTLASRTPNPEEAAKKWTGDLFLQADKEVSYELLRNVMFTAGMAGYKQFRLTVQKQEED